MAPNGCTGVPWTTSFEWCCDEHDLAYEEAESFKDKVIADWRLRQCIGGLTGWLVFLAVSTVGIYFYYRAKNVIHD